MLKGLSIRYFLLSFFILIVESNTLFAFPANGNNNIKNHLAYDANSQSIPIFSQLQPILTFTAGAFITQLGQSHRFAPLDLCSYNYKPQGSPITNILWGGFLGSEVRHFTSWELIAGLGYYQPNSLSTKGILTQGVDPQSNSTYSYRYKTQSQQLLAEGKLY